MRGVGGWISSLLAISTESEGGMGGLLLSIQTFLGGMDGNAGQKK